MSHLLPFSSFSTPSLSHTETNHSLSPACFPKLHMVTVQGITFLWVCSKEAACCRVVLHAVPRRVLNIGLVYRSADIFGVNKSVCFLIDALDLDFDFHPKSEHSTESTWKVSSVSFLLIKLKDMSCFFIHVWSIYKSRSNMSVLTARIQNRNSEGLEKMGSCWCWMQVCHSVTLSAK